MTALKAFQPSATKGKLASLFTILEIGEENRGKPIAAPAIESCELIWSDDKSALLFATANPLPSQRILVLEFCFYSFTGTTVGGLPTFYVLRQPEKTQESPQN